MPESFLFFNDSSGKAEIVILILLIILGTVLVGGLKPYRKPLPPSPAAIKTTMQDTVHSTAHSTLQLEMLVPENQTRNQFSFATGSAK